MHTALESTCNAQHIWIAVHPNNGFAFLGPHIRTGPATSKECKRTSSCRRRLHTIEQPPSLSHSRAPTLGSGQVPVLPPEPHRLTPAITHRFGGSPLRGRATRWIPWMTCDWQGTRQRSPFQTTLHHEKSRWRNSSTSTPHHTVVRALTVTGIYIAAKRNERAHKIDRRAHRPALD